MASNAIIIDLNAHNNVLLSDCQRYGISPIISIQIRGGGHQNMNVCKSNINTIMFYMHVTHIRHNYWYCLLHCSQLMIVILGQRLDTPRPIVDECKLAAEVCWNRNSEISNFK